MAAVEVSEYNTAAMQVEEHSLVREARDGSVTAFERLFRAHERRLYALALHLLGDVGEAEDVTQEAFVRAWEHLGRLRREAAFGGWLRRIALNLIWDRLRSRPAAEPLEPQTAESLADPGEPPDQRVLGSEQARRVRQAVLALPEHQRLVLAMYYWEEMSVEEIAQVLGIARGTALSRLARGRDALKRRLGPWLREGMGVSEDAM